MPSRDDLTIEQGLRSQIESLEVRLDDANYTIQQNEYDLAGYREKIRHLEYVVDERDRRIRDLEYELDAVERRLRRAEEDSGSRW